MTSHDTFYIHRLSDSYSEIAHEAPNAMGIVTPQECGSGKTKWKG